MFLNAGITKLVKRKIIIYCFYQLNLVYYCFHPSAIITWDRILGLTNRIANQFNVIKTDTIRLIMSRLYIVVFLLHNNCRMLKILWGKHMQFEYSHIINHSIQFTNCMKQQTNSGN